MKLNAYTLKNTIVKTGCKISITFLMALNCVNVQAQQYLITTAVGTGSQSYSGDGGLATNAHIHGPSGVSFDAQGNLYIADTYNNRIRKVNASTGIITTIAGNGIGGFSGDGGAATAARINLPTDVITDPQGNVYIADYANNRIRKVNAVTGIITTVAGNGQLGYNGDGGAATAARIQWPQEITLDAQNNLYIADAPNHRVRKVNASTGIIATVAGIGTAGYSGDGGLATAAQLNFPTGVAIDSQGNLHIADMSNNRIRKVNATTGIITTIAGNGVQGYWGDGVPAISSILYWPASLSFDAQDNIYITDYWNNRLRRINPSTGIITTLAGVGFSGSAGDGGLSTSAQLFRPKDAIVDVQGNIYIADTDNSRIRKLTTCPTVTAPANQYVICGIGNSILLSVGGATASTWSTGQTSSNINVAPTTNTSYVVTYTDNVGCVNVKNISVIVSATIPSISVNNTTICAGSSALILPSGASTYSITGGSFTVSPNVTTSYSVLGTNALGCAASNTAVVTVSVTSPNVVITSDSVICENDESAILSASGANTYTWSQISSNGITKLYGASVGVVPVNNITYTVQGMDEQGCFNSASITLRLDACTKMSELNEQKAIFRVYPNPVNEILNIENLGENKELLVSFTDMLGREIKQTVVEKDMNIADVQSGVYVLRLVNEKKEIIHQQKLIKK